MAPRGDPGPPLSQAALRRPSCAQTCPGPDLPGTGTREPSAQGGGQRLPLPDPPSFRAAGAWKGTSGRDPPSAGLRAPGGSGQQWAPLPRARRPPQFSTGRRTAPRGRDRGEGSGPGTGRGQGPGADSGAGGTGWDGAHSGGRPGEKLGPAALGAHLEPRGRGAQSRSSGGSSRASAAMARGAGRAGRGAGRSRSCSAAAAGAQAGGGGGRAARGGRSRSGASPHPGAQPAQIRRLLPPGSAPQLPAPPRAPSSPRTRQGSRRGRPSGRRRTGSSAHGPGRRPPGGSGPFGRMGRSGPVCGAVGGAREADWGDAGVGVGMPASLGETHQHLLPEPSTLSALG